jgi:hypothetical protein
MIPECMDIVAFLDRFSDQPACIAHLEAVPIMALGHEKQ